MLKTLSDKLTIINIQYGAPFMFKKVVRRQIPSLLANNETTSSSTDLNDKLVMKTIAREQEKILSSEITKQFKYCEEVERKNPNAKAWLPFSAVFIATYTVLVKQLKVCDHNTGMKLLHEAVCNIIPVSSERIVSGLLKHNTTALNPNYLESVKQFLGESNGKYPGWKMSTDVHKEIVITSNGDQKEISFVKSRVDYCVMNRFFRAHNMQSVMPAMCSFDCIWSKCLNAPQIGLKFRRRKVLSLGDDHCEFSISKDFTKDQDDVIMEHMEKK